MDAAGAAALRVRIEQHQHWLEAGTVRDGVQESYDPHARWLLEIHDGLRVYADDTGRFVKRLTDGAWLLEQGRAA
jgi:hypothetical protein